MASWFTWRPTPSDKGKGGSIRSEGWRETPKPSVNVNGCATNKLSDYVCRIGPQINLYN